MKFTVIIPARYQSRRLPGKVLMPINGKAIINHVCDRAKESGAETIIVATDDNRIAEVAEEAGSKVCMTSSQHCTGSDRIAEVCQLMQLDNEEIIVNIQGDEPFIPAANIQQVAENLHQRPECQISTLCAPILDEEELFNLHVTKVVRNEYGHALYFSRAAIPSQPKLINDKNRNKDSNKDNSNIVTHKAATLPANTYYRHIGIYGYRVAFLKEYCQWPRPTIEKLESLEQLRALAYGAKIFVADAIVANPQGIDTMEDLEKLRQLIEI